MPSRGDIYEIDITVSDDPPQRTARISVCVLHQHDVDPLVWVGTDAQGNERMMTMDHVTDNQSIGHVEDPSEWINEGCTLPETRMPHHVQPDRPAQQPRPVRASGIQSVSPPAPAAVEPDGDSDFDEVEAVEQRTCDYCNATHASNVVHDCSWTSKLKCVSCDILRKMPKTALPGNASDIVTNNPVELYLFTWVTV